MGNCREHFFFLNLPDTPERGDPILDALENIVLLHRQLFRLCLTDFGREWGVF